MFLIEYRKDKFVNGDLIDWVEIINHGIKFTVQTDQENIYDVDSEFKNIFINHLNMINSNISKLVIDNIHEQGKK